LFFAIASGLAIALLTAGACGGGDGGGLTVLGDKSATPTPASASPTVSATASASPTTSGEPTPVMSGDGGDPFGDDSGAATAADLEAYLGDAKPIHREVVRVETIAGDMLIEVSAVPDDSWDVAADRTEGYADQIAMQAGLWLDLAPPNGLQDAHQTQATALETEAEMLDLLATQLRSRTWNVVKGTKDVNRLSKEVQQLRESYRAELEARATDLGVQIPWKWQ
jgi:hypothetical protein